MYQIISQEKTFQKVKFSDKIYGFPMASPKKIFTIENYQVKNIVIISQKLAHPLISKKVSKEYQKLLTMLMELITSDDDTGESYREALNRIERFRQEIKNKYRHFLKQKELEKMANQLKIFQKEANTRLIELQNALYEMNLHQGKGK